MKQDRRLISNNSAEISVVYNEDHLQRMTQNIALCIKNINEQRNKAIDAKNLTGIFKGKKRDIALADAMIISSDTQAQTVQLIQETIKLFFYCFKFQEDKNSSRNEEIFNFIISQTDDEDTKKFLNEVGDIFASYQNTIKDKINVLKYDISNLENSNQRHDVDISVNKTEIINIKNKLEKCMQNKIAKIEQKNEDNTDKIEDLEKLFAQQGQALTEKNTELDKKYADTMDELKEEISKKDRDINNRITDLIDRIDNFDIVTSKIGWKIGISVVAIGSLTLNILQMCGVF